MFNCEDNSNIHIDDSGILNLYFSHYNRYNDDEYEMLLINDSLDINKKIQLSKINYFEINNLQTGKYNVIFNWISNGIMINRFDLGAIDIHQDSIAFSGISITNLRTVLFSNIAVKKDYSINKGSIIANFDIQSFEHQSRNSFTDNRSGKIILRSYDNLQSYFGKINSNGKYEFKSLPMGYYSCYCTVEDDNSNTYISPNVVNVFVYPQRKSIVDLNVSLKFIRDQELLGKFKNWEKNFIK